MKTPRQLKELYDIGHNIARHLRDDQGLEQNSREIIEIAYELQTGSYIAAMQDPETAERKANYSSQIAKVIRSLCAPKSILEAGVGEATTLSGVLAGFGETLESYGFDLSWSRVAYAQRWLRSNGHSRVTLCTGDLLEIPFSDSSVDVVYTSHSIEPNGGNETPILSELYRVCRSYLILLEPGYELASVQAQARMTAHGYCRGLKDAALALGLNVLTHELFPYSANPLNPTAITIIAKNATHATAPNTLACPKFKTSLKLIDDWYYSPEALVLYPIIGGIPCLRVQNGIFASKFDEMFGSVDVGELEPTPSR